jgi:hypothetical protein
LSVLDFQKKRDLLIRALDLHAKHEIDRTDPKYPTLAAQIESFRVMSLQSRTPYLKILLKILYYPNKGGYWQIQLDYGHFNYLCGKWRKRIDWGPSDE